MMQGALAPPSNPQMMDSRLQVQPMPHIQPRPEASSFPAGDGLSTEADRGGGFTQDDKERERDDRRRKEKERVQKERAEKERIRKEHARKVLEEQKIQKARRKWQKDSEFLCHLKFRNNLPDPPLGPHFLEIPLSLDKMVEYTPTTLETGHKWKLHCDRNLGVDIDVIDPRSYMMPPDRPPLDPEDMELLRWEKPETEADVNETTGRSARRKNVDTSVTWLKKTVYLTNDPFDSVHKFRSDKQIQDQNKEKIGRDVEAIKKTDRISAILQSFTDANSKKKLEHATNKSLTVEWVMPVLPDVSLWGNTFTHVTFDVDPTEEERLTGSSPNRKRQRAERAIIGNVRQIKKKDGGSDLITSSYVVPNVDDDEWAEDGDSDGASNKPAPAKASYQWVKDYQMNVQDYTMQAQTSDRGNILFVIDESTNKATYCQLNARVDLVNLPPEDQVTRGPRTWVSRRKQTEEEVANIRNKIAKDLGVTARSDKGSRDGNGGTRAGSSEGEGNGSGGSGRRSHPRFTSADLDGDQESVMTEPLESEGSNIAVKGTDTSEGDELSRMDDSEEDDL